MPASNKDRVETAASRYQIAILGAGPVGVNLAKALLGAGHTVSISNSRGPESLSQQAKDTGARAMDAIEATAGADIVILAVPEASVPVLRTMLQASLRPDTILLDTGNYYPSRDAHIDELDRGEPESVWVSKMFSPPVVKAFNNIVASNMVLSAKFGDSSQRVALPVSGDNSRALGTIMTLVQDVGFEPYNAGSLAESWRYQPGQPAYCTEPTTEQLVKLLGQADRARGPVRRDQGRAIFEKLPPDFSGLTLLRFARLSAGLDLWSIRSYLAAMQVGLSVSRTVIVGRRG